MKRRRKTRRRIFRKKMRGGALEDTRLLIIKFKNDPSKNTASDMFKISDSPRSGGVEQLPIPYIDGINEKDVELLVISGKLTEEKYNDGTVAYIINDSINSA
jgi:hypothetical protein